MLKWWLYFFRGMPAGQLFISLVSLPFATALMLHLAGPKMGEQILPMVIFTGLIIFALWLMVSKQHLRHVLQVTDLDDTLELKSPLFSKKIHWHEVKNFSDLGNNEYLLECKDRDYFLSKELTNSEQLFTSIRKNMPPNTVQYRISCLTNDSFIERVHVSITVLAISVVWSIVSEFPVGSAEVDAALVLQLTVFLAVSIGLWWVCTFRIPRVMRIGDTGIFVRLKGESQALSWAQIENIRTITPWIVLITTSRSWFIVLPKALSCPKEMREKLIECKKNLPSIRNG